MLSRQEEEQERIETLRNDLLVQQQQKQREQGSTFHQHGLSQADEVNQGRFRSVGVPNVIGSKPAVASAYPACSPTLSVQLPDEPPLGFNNPALDDPTGGSSVTLPVATGAPVSGSDAPSSATSFEEQRPTAGSPPSSPNQRVGGPASGEISQPRKSEGQAGPSSNSANDNAGSNK